MSDQSELFSVLSYRKHLAEATTILGGDGYYEDSRPFLIKGKFWERQDGTRWTHQNSDGTGPIVPYNPEKHSGRGEMARDKNKPVVHVKFGLRGRKFQSAILEQLKGKLPKESFRRLLNVTPREFVQVAGEVADIIPFGTPGRGRDAPEDESGRAKPVGSETAEAIKPVTQNSDETPTEEGASKKEPSLKGPTPKDSDWDSVAHATQTLQSVLQGGDQDKLRETVKESLRAVRKFPSGSSPKLREASMEAKKNLLTLDALLYNAKQSPEGSSPKIEQKIQTSCADTLRSLKALRQLKS